MVAGAMRDRVRFERRTVTAGDGAGNFEEEWAAVAAAVWAEIRPARGRETVLASKLQGVAPVEIRVRWSDALGEGAARLTTDDRAVDVRTGDVYNIRAVEDLEKRRKILTITAEGGVAT